MSSSDSTDDQAQPDSGLAFFGTITASVTHELNNVMSIIEQMAGLLDDLCVGAEYGRPIENEKLREISAKVAKQVERGVGIIKRLNFFAHSVDEPVGTFELNDLLRNLVELCGRFADLKRVRLEADYAPEQLTITSSPFLLERAVFVGIQSAMLVAVKDRVVRVISRAEGSGAAISIEAAAAPDSEDAVAELNSLQILMRRLEGSVHTNIKGDRRVCRLVFPSMSKEALL